MFRKSWVISLILSSLLVGAVLATSSTGFAWWPSYGPGGQGAYPWPIEGAPIAVTGVRWHVKPSDYRYVDEAILRLHSTDGRPHRVKLYLTLMGPDDRILHRGVRTLLVRPHIRTVVFSLDEVLAADVVRLSLTATPFRGNRR